MKIGTQHAKAIIQYMNDALGYSLDPEQFPLGMTIEPNKRRRSNEANALYWVIVSALAQEVGMSKDEMHNEILADFHGYDLVEFRGTVIKKPKGRSHNLPSETFSQLMLIAERWAAEVGAHWDNAA